MIFEKLKALFTKSEQRYAQRSEPNATKESSSQGKRVDVSRIGELGEYKIDVQLRQLPKEDRYLSDVLLPNPKSRTGYSQIDHIVITPCAVFVIETKNYQGLIKGKRTDQTWVINGRFHTQNPLRQNYGPIKAIESLLVDEKGLRFISMVSYTRRCQFSVDPDLRKIRSDELVVYDVELSEYLQRKSLQLQAENARPLLSASDIARIHGVIAKANISDWSTRQEHNRSAAVAKSKKQYSQQATSFEE